MCPVEMSQFVNMKSITADDPVKKKKGRSLWLKSNKRGKRGP